MQMMQRMPSMSPNNKAKGNNKANKANKGKGKGDKKVFRAHVEHD